MESKSAAVVRPKEKYRACMIYRVTVLYVYTQAHWHTHTNT